MSAHRLDMSREDAERALYIDFEGTRDEPASFLGVFCEGIWTVSVVEPALYSASSVQHRLGEVRPGDRAAVLRSLMQRSTEEGRPIVAWSSRELTEVLASESWSVGEANWWNEHLLNALPPAKAWARRTGIEVPAIPSTFGGRENRWSLSGFRKATGYPGMAALFEPGKTAARIRNVRQQLAKHGEYSQITANAKRKWTNVLTHNFHDCAGLAFVVRKVVEGNDL